MDMTTNIASDMDPYIKEMTIPEPNVDIHQDQTVQVALAMDLAGEMEAVMDVDI